MVYQIKIWLSDIFSYSQERLDINTSLDYNDYWEEKRGDSVGVLSDWQKERADIIIKALNLQKSVTIGDIGCGEGSILKYLKERLDVNETIGYDSSQFVLQKARAIGVSDVVLVDINNSEELNCIKEVDYNIMLEILEHVPQSEIVLDIAYKMAKKGVFFSFPNSGFFTYRLRLLFGKFPKQWVTFPNEHLRFWTATDLKYWLSALGYKKYKIFYYKGVPVLNKLLPSVFAAAFVVYIPKDV